MKPLSIVSRAFNSKVKDMAITPEEKAALEGQGVSDPTIQRYLLWRKASIVMVIVATVLSALVSTYSTYMEDEDAPDVMETLSETFLKKMENQIPALKSLGLTSETIDAAKEKAAPLLDAAKQAAADAAPGADEKKDASEKEDEGEKKAGGKKEEEKTSTGEKIVEAAHILSLYMMPVAALFVLSLKNRYRLAFRVLAGTFLVSFFLPILIDLLPMSLWETPSTSTKAVDVLKDQIQDIKEGATVLAALLPAVLSLIPGVQKACLRVKGLLPQSLLPGWFVVVASSLYGLFLLVIFVAIDQVTEQPAVLAALGLLSLASLVYAFRAGVITRPLLTEKDFKAMKMLQLTVTLITAIAGIVLVVFLLSNDIMGIHLVGFDAKKSLMSPIDLLEMGLEIISRSMFVSVVGAELMMRINLMSWQQGRAVSASESAGPYDGAMEQMATVAGA